MSEEIGPGITPADEITEEISREPEPAPVDAEPYKVEAPFLKFGGAMLGDRQHTWFEEVATGHTIGAYPGDVVDVKRIVDPEHFVLEEFAKESNDPPPPEQEARIAARRAGILRRSAPNRRARLRSRSGR